MASIRPRGVKKDGTFSYQVTVYIGKDAEGKRMVQNFSFVSRSKAPTKAQKEVEAYAAELDAKVRNGDILTDEKITFAQFVKIWEKNWLPAKTPTVRQNYMCVLRARVIPYIGEMKLIAVRATHIDNILKEKLAGKAANTIRMTYAVTNSVFRYALKKQYIRENPCLRCDDLPSVSLKSGKDLSFFTLDQAKRFLRDALTQKYDLKISGHKRILKKTGVIYQVADYSERHSIHFMWRVYFTLAIYGGFRRGELCALTWRDIDMEKGIVSINKALVSVKGGQLVKEPKTSAGMRDIMLPADCIELMKQWKQQQRMLRMKLGSAWEGHWDQTKEDGAEDSFEDNNLFIQLDTGLPIHLSTPGHKFHEILDMYNATCEKEKDKLPHIRLHDLRHTSATLLLSTNMDIETVAHRLGHSKPSVTLDIYGHALPENDKQASDTIGAMFAG